MLYAGGVIPFPTTGPAAGPVQDSTAPKPQSKTGITTASRPAAASQSSKATNRRGRIYIADNMQLTSNSTSGWRPNGGSRAGAAPGGLRKTQGPAGREMPCTTCSIPIPMPSCNGAGLAESLALYNNSLGHLQGILSAHHGLPAPCLMPAVMPNLWPSVAGPTFAPSTPLPPYGLQHTSMLPQAYTALAAFAGASQAALLQQEYLRLISDRQQQLHSLSGCFPVDSVFPTADHTAAVAAAACSSLAPCSNEGVYDNTDKLDGNLLNLLLPIGVPAASGVGVVAGQSAADTAQATAGHVASAEVLHLSGDANSCDTVDVSDPARDNIHPIMHMFSGLSLTKAQPSSNSKAAAGLQLQHTSASGLAAPSRSSDLAGDDQESSCHGSLASPPQAASLLC